MNIKTILELVDGKLINGDDINRIKKIKIDSRTVDKGDLFIALKGKNNDGHKYIKEVLKKKPSAIIVCENIDVKTKVPIILVRDTYESLINLGAFFRSKYDVPLIAVTGSVGKTTTKELIYEVLSVKYKVLKNYKNYNNHIGLPLTLFKLNSSYDICVVEIGMNHQGEISKLSRLCKPSIGIITNIGTAHIGNLGSKKNIFKAKMEILEGMDNGFLLVNGSDKYLKKVKYKNLIKCGNDLKPININVYDKTSFDLTIDNKTHTFIYNSPNQYLISNFLFAIQIGLLFKIDIEDIKKVLLNYQMPKERMNIHIKGSTKIIDDCYNASLESVLASIDVLNKETNNKVLILGDILELGKFSHKIHKQIGKKLKKLKDIKVLLVGEEIKYIKNKNYKYFNNNREVIDYLSKLDIINTTILVKGSRRMHLEEVINFVSVKSFGDF